MAKSFAKVNLGQLDEIRRKLSKGYYVKVGILSNSQHPGSDFGMVELGMVHEFGSATKNIPPRSFLRMPLVEKRSELIKSIAAKKQIAEAFEEGDILKVFKLIGFIAEGIVHQAFETGGFGKWQKLKPKTVKRKGSSAILVDTGELERSVTSKAVAPNA